MPLRARAGDSRAGRDDLQAGRQRHRFQAEVGIDDASGGFDFYYYRSCRGTANTFGREYGDGGEVENFYSQNAATRVKREWGEQALLDQALIRAHGLLNVFHSPPISLGAALWAGIDHGRGHHLDPFWGGLLDSFRLPKYSYAVFKSQYEPGFKLRGIATGPMVSIAHELPQASGRGVVVFSNCEQVRLAWLGRVVGTSGPANGFEGMPHPPIIFPSAFEFHEIARLARQDGLDLDAGRGSHWRPGRVPRGEALR